MHRYLVVFITLVPLLLGHPGGLHVFYRSLPHHSELALLHHSEPADYLLL